MKKVKIDPATQRRPSSRKQQRNAKIRESLNQQVEVQVIPALEDMEGYEKRKPRVCAYCRVSTDMDTQALSYELQVQNYTEYINSNPDWEFAGIFIMLLFCAKDSMLFICKKPILSDPCAF